MIKALINKIIRNKNRGENTRREVQIPLQVQEEPLADIIITKENNYYKLEITDYITIGEYVERMEGTCVEESISNSALWNSRKQKVNKGIYYIIRTDNILYNIMIGEYTIIDERISHQNMTEEKIIRLEKENNDYGLTLFRHDENGSTFYVRYYYRNGFSMGKLDLSNEETYEEIKSIIESLENIENINNILDIELLKEKVLKDLKQPVSRKKEQKL